MRQQELAVDFISAVDAGLRGVSDPEVLDRVASAKRVLVSHDRRTMLKHFRSRLVVGKSSPGLLVVSQNAPIRLVIESIRAIRPIICRR